MKRPLVVVGVALVVLAAVLLFLRSRGGDARRSRQPSADGRPPGPAGVRGRGEGRQGAEMAFYTENDPEGTLRLEGQVIDADDAPVGGANVVLGSNPPRAVVSEADGSFFFDKLVARRYRLIARSDRGVAGPITWRLSESSGPAILRLRPAASLRVTVKQAADQSPVASAAVELRGMDVQSAVTGPDGTARIAPVASGRYDLVAQAPGLAPGRTWVRVPPGPVVTEVSVELSAGAAVSGRVVAEDGDPVPGAQVVYSGASDWAQRADPRRDAVTTDAEGRFSFPALPAGSFRFVARHDVYAPGSSELVTLDGVTERSGVEITVQKGASIRGKVVTQANEPVASASVRIAASGRGLRWVRPRETLTDEQGRFELGGLPREPHELLATHELGSSEVVEEDLSSGPAEREVVLTLDVLGTIAGTVVDPAGDPVEGAEVRARPARRGGMGPGGGRGGWAARRLRGRQMEVTDSSGHFEIGGLEPGEYAVSASRPGARWGRGRGRRDDAVVAETGATDVVVVLAPGGGVKGKVAFADGSAPSVYSVSTGFRGGTPFAAKDGSFELGDLPAQTYNLRISGAGFDSRDLRGVEVKDGEVTDVGTVEVRKGREVSGRVTSGGAPVAGAKVLVGPRLFGSGSSSQMQGGRMPMARSTKETVTDERGEFAVHGVGIGDLVVVAEHDRIGRSHAYAVRGTRESVTGLDLELLPFGALEGTVTSAGEPVENSAVSAQAKTAPDAVYAVSTGPDGKFRFDKLAPDEYKVSAVSGGGRHGGRSSYSTSAVVTSGQTTRVDIVVESGQVELVVAVVPREGGESSVAQVLAVRGEVQARTARELELAVAALGEGFSARGLSAQGNPARIRELPPGAYTVCATPFPVELHGMMDAMSYLEREGGNLAVFCRKVAVAEAPPEQSAQIEVEIPAFVPPPSED